MRAAARGASAAAIDAVGREAALELGPAFLDEQLPELVELLQRLQDARESSLMRDRTELLDRHQTERQNIRISFSKRAAGLSADDESRGALRAEQDEAMQAHSARAASELGAFDRGILAALDELTQVQQNLIVEADVLPGFVVSSSGSVVMAQRRLLEALVQFGTVARTDGTGRFLQYYEASIRQ